MKTALVFFALTPLVVAVGHPRMITRHASEMSPTIVAAHAQQMDVHESGKTETLSKSDKAFLRKAHMDAIFAIELGNRAMLRATRDDVRKYGERAVVDYADADKRLVELGKRKGLVDLPTGLDDEHRKVVDELSKLDGAALDRKYVDVTVASEQSGVDDFTRATTKAADAEVRAFAGKTAPTLAEHLKEIRAIEERVRDAAQGGGKGK